MYHIVCHQRCFSTLWYRIYMSLELFQRFKHCSSVRYDLSWCFNQCYSGQYGCLRSPAWSWLLIPVCVVFFVCSPWVHESFLRVLLFFFYHTKTMHIEYANYLQVFMVHPEELVSHLGLMLGLVLGDTGLGSKSRIKLLQNLLFFWWP